MALLHPHQRSPRLLKQLALLLLFLLIHASVTGQQALLAGNVTDEQGDPLPSASLRIQAGSKMVKFTTSDNDGNFAFALDSVGSNYLLITAYLGKQADTLGLMPGAVLTQLAIRLVPALESLPSVEVIGDRTTVFNKSDTTVYETEVYRDSTDRRIEEVLRKIPGVEVAESGAIEVNGKPLYRLLIEDADLFQSDYQLGSKNIRAKDIKSVEVIDHYQENRVLRSVNTSDKIVLNLRLEDDVKATVAGNGIAGGGYGGKEAKVYNHLNAFLIGKRHKFITLLDWNNVGQDNGADFQSLFSDETDWTVFPYSFVEIGNPYQLDLLQLDPDYLDNTNRRLATLRQDSKLGKNWHLSLNLTGKGNQREQATSFSQELLSDQEEFNFSQVNEFTAQTTDLNIKGQLDYVEPGNKGKLDIYFGAESKKQQLAESILQGNNPFSLAADERGQQYHLSSRYTKEIAQGMVAQFGLRTGSARQADAGTIANPLLINLFASPDSVTNTFGQDLIQRHFGHQAEARLLWNTAKVLHEFTANYAAETFEQEQQNNNEATSFYLPDTTGMNQLRSTDISWTGIVKVAKKYKVRLAAKGGIASLDAASITRFWTHDLNARLETILKNGGRLRFVTSTGNRLSPLTNANPVLFVPEVFTVQQVSLSPTAGRYALASVHLQHKNDLKFRDFQLSLVARTDENAPTPNLAFFDQLTIVQNRFDGQRSSLSLRARQSVYFPDVRADLAVSLQPQYVGFQYRLGAVPVQGNYFATSAILELTVTPLPRLRFKTQQLVNWRRPRDATQSFVGWQGTTSLTLDRKGWSVGGKTSFARNSNGKQSSFYLTESVWLQLKTGPESMLRINSVNLFDRQNFQAVFIDDQFITVRGVDGPGRFVYATLDFSF